MHYFPLDLLHKHTLNEGSARLNTNLFQMSNAKCVHTMFIVLRHNFTFIDCSLTTSVTYVDNRLANQNTER